MNNYDAVKAILSPDPPSDIFNKNFRGQSALHLAVRNPGIVSLLLDAGYSSEVDPTDQHGMTPLVYATAYGAVESTKMLLMAGADPYHRDELTGMGMWYYAISCQQTEFIQEVLGFYMATNSKMARTALEICLWIRMIHREPYLEDLSIIWRNTPYRTLEYLLQLRSTQRLSFYQNLSLLHFCRDDNEARLLLTYSCDGINRQNNRGYTPMMVISRHTAPADALGMLVEQSADVETQDNHGMNALHHLTTSTMDRTFWDLYGKENLTNWLDATAVLLSAGGNINQRDNCSCPCSSDGCSPIRAIFWKDDNSFHSRKNALEAIPWILELFLVLSHSGQERSLAQAVLDLHRYQTFEEWGMIHTCCIHDGGHWDFGPRPRVEFYRPHEDFHRNQDDCRAETPRETSEEWDSEFIEITNEQEELAQLLDQACADYAVMLNGAIQDRLVELLARRVVLLEHQLEGCLAKERSEPLHNVEPEVRQVLLIIC